MNKMYCYLYLGHCKLRIHTAVEENVCRLFENTVATVEVIAAGIVE